MNLKKRTLRCTTALLATLALSLSGCGKTTRSAASAGGSAPAPASGKAASTQKTAKPTSQPADEDDAENQAIDFHNNLRGYLGAANKPLEKITDALREAVNDARRDGNANSSRWRTLTSSLGDFPKVAKFELPVPEAFSSEDKAFFTTGIQSVSGAATEVLVILKRTAAYYEAEDYKDDWFKQLYLDARRIDELASVIEKNTDPLVERASDITEAIDARNVAKIAVGPYVLNMRAFQKKYREMLACLLRDEFKAPEYGTRTRAEEITARVEAAREWADRADALCAELDKMAAGQRALVVEGYEGTRYEKIYQSFYKQYDDTKGNTRRVIRALRENGTITDEWKVLSDQKDIGRKSGEFADLWNDKGSAGK